MAYNASSELWEEKGNRIYGDAQGWYITDGEQGVSISADGTRIAIGGNAAPANGQSTAGMARVLDYNASSNLWVPKGADLFGTSSSGAVGRAVRLSADGATLAVGYGLNNIGRPSY